MSLPDAERKPFLTGERTAAYEGKAAEPGSPVGRVQVDLAPASGPLPTREIQILLGKRLRVMSLILVVVFAVVLPTNFFSYKHTPELVWFVLAPDTFMLAAAATLAAILWSKRQLSLARLRLIELLALGVVTLGFSWIHYNSVRIWLPIYAARGRVDVAILATFTSHVWFVLIFAYGAFIPNTWRRCAAMVGLLALIPLAIGAAVGLSDGAVERPLLGHFLLLTTILMSTAVAMAVFGSHHIQVLRQQAYEARKLGQYQLKGRLGAGGMGEVYLAEHVLLRRPCAIKLIRPERAGDSRHVVRFEREVRTMATLTHPNTVQVFDYGHSEDGTFYYVMEYLPGLTLERLVTQHGPLPPGRAIHFLRQLCGALREAHAVGLIHRDVKPSNVIVCQRGGVDDTAKLLDFGLVLPPAGGLESEKLTQEGAVTGTPTYMSPEQAGGQENLDARSDVYSVGALAYFLLTGQPPFAGRSPVKILAAHLYELPAPLTQHRPDVPADLEAVVLRCLAKEPAERYADAESLEMALAGCPSAETWSVKESARWWRGRADAHGKGGSDGVNDWRCLTNG
jgi:eukaryotic-like serine/threonine-protein kinase